MTEWIDVLVYVALMIVIWFALPAAGARFTRALIADRNPDWLAAHAEVSHGMAHSRICRLVSYVFGTVSIAALVAAQAGVWPTSLSAPAFEPERWMVLSDILTAAVMLWLVYAVSTGALFTRWLERTVPLAERRRASLERRSVEAFVSRRMRLAVYIAIGGHLAVWLIVGVLGAHTSSTFWPMFASQFAISFAFFVIARIVAERRPNSLDDIFGPAFRRTEVRFAFVAQLMPLMNGGMRLYEAITGIVPPGVDRLSRLGLVVFMVAGVVIGFCRYTWSTPAGPDRRPSGGASPGGHAVARGA